MSINEYNYYLSKIRSWEQHLDTLIKHRDADYVLDKVVVLFIQLDEYQKIQGILGGIGVTNVHEGFLDANTHDRKLIHQNAPIFFNLIEHRLINKSDVSSVLAQADRYLSQFL